MSGHSKWATTKHHKAKADQKRAGAFTKVAKLIMVAARDGADPDMNFKLRLAIDKAKAINMPKDNIERAVKKGAGLIEGEQYFDVLYEAYAPGGVALLIEATTDNKNRTASNVRTVLNKQGGSFGAAKSVTYMFKKKGMIVFAKPANFVEDELMLELVEQGADDVSFEDDVVVVYSTVEDFLQVKKYIEDKAWTVEMAELEMIADNMVDLSDDEARAKLEKLIDILEEDDDVEKV